MRWWRWDDCSECEGSVSIFVTRKCLGVEIDDGGGGDGTGVHQHPVAPRMRGAEGAAEFAGPEGVRGVDHRVERERQVDGGVCHRPRACVYGEALLPVGRGQRAPRVVQGFGVFGGGSRGEHQARRGGGQVDGGCRPCDARELHLAVPAQQGVRARVGEQGGVCRGVHECPALDLREAGLQGSVQVGSRGRHQKLHRN